MVRPLRHFINFIRFLFSGFLRLLKDARRGRTAADSGGGSVTDWLERQGRVASVPAAGESAVLLLPAWRVYTDWSPPGPPPQHSSTITRHTGTAPRRTTTPHHPALHCSHVASAWPQYIKRDSLVYFDNYFLVPYNSPADNFDCNVQPLDIEHRKFSYFKEIFRKY